MTIQTASKKLQRVGAVITEAREKSITAMLNGYTITYREWGISTLSATNRSLGYTGGSDHCFHPSLTAAIRHCK